MLSKGCEIYDIKCFDANIPPINSEKYSNEEFTKNCIMNHLALNTILLEQLDEQEKEIIELNRSILVVKYQVENDPNYVRNLYKAYKLSRAKKFEFARRQAAEKAMKIKSEEQKDVKKGEGGADVKN